MKKEKPLVIAIVGPTAIGKSDFAVALAKKLDGEIISADSRQVYVGLDIGTGKIKKKEMRGIPHHLLDVANPKVQFSVADFKILAEEKIIEIFGRGKIPIVCGGTGLYVDTLLSGAIYPEVPPNKSLRKILASKTADELFVILKKLDSTRAKNIDSKNPVRLIRAIEIAKAIGKVPKVRREKKYRTLYIGLDANDDILRSNIHARLLTRIKGGMIEEVKNLQKNGLSWKRLHELGLEYRYVALFLQNKNSKNKISKAEMLLQLEKEIWQYAKRQRTWWKRNKEILWIKSK